MSSWEDIQAVKVKRNILREKLEKRKKERQDLLGSSTPGVAGAVVGFKLESGNILGLDEKGKHTWHYNQELKLKLPDIDVQVEKCLVQVLADQTLILPSNSAQIAERVETRVQKPIMRDSIAYYLHKLAGQKLINIKEVSIGGSMGYEVISAQHLNLQALHDDMNAMNHDAHLESPSTPNQDAKKRRKTDYSNQEQESTGAGSAGKIRSRASVTAREEARKGGAVGAHGDSLIACKTSEIMSLLSLPSTREKQSKKVGEEILELLSKPTAKERSLAEKFKSQGGAQVMEFCPHGTRVECMRSFVAIEMAIEAIEAEESNDAASVQNVNDDVAAVATPATGTDEDNDDDASQTEPTEASKEDCNKEEVDSDDKSESKPVPVATEAAASSDDNPLPVAGDQEPASSVPPRAKHQCNKLHFKKIIQNHTDETLGDCSFLNTCFHMDTCKYVHYEVDTFVGHQTPNHQHLHHHHHHHHHRHTTVPPSQLEPLDRGRSESGPKPPTVGQKRATIAVDACATLYPPQWIQCDLRFLDMTVLGKFAVVMADPPWDIHMELPYGTMSDDEMRQLGVPALQDDGLIFLWVTGRAMELGRECLKLWGYERVDELIWVKTNQLQRIIRTGRTGHWLNHGKEHCLVGMKGNPPNLNRGLDCDVIVAEVRATSHKPDEIYGIIERLSPGTRKIELFGRPHNVQPNWITLGNQLDGIRLVDPELINSFQKRYPDGNCMTPGKNS